jgi:hypothetical protein
LKKAPAASGKLAAPASGTIPCRLPLGQLEGISKMVEEAGKPPDPARGMAVRRLVKETGITEAQAAELVSFLGPHSWASLLREARILKKS